MKIVTLAQRSLQPASHEDPLHPGVLKKVLLSADDFTSTIQMINWARIEPGEAFQNHYHENLEEVFYIFSGEGEITSGGEATRVHAGTAIFIPAREHHLMRNVGSEPLLYLAVGAREEGSVGGSTVVVEYE